MSERLHVIRLMPMGEHEKVMEKTSITFVHYQRVDQTAAQIQGWFPPVQIVVFPETPTEALNLKGVNENHDNSY